MYDMIREWPRYLKVPFPIAKVKTVEVDDMQCCIYMLSLKSFNRLATIFLLLLCCYHAKTIHIFYLVGPYIVTFCCLSPHSLHKKFRP